MKISLLEAGYSLDEETNVWSRTEHASIAYSDGDEVETRVAKIIKEASDLSVLSTELRSHITDWPSLYHLSSSRANILRPYEELFQSGHDVLEIGSGCGAITRFIGECGASVIALEGSHRRAGITQLRNRDQKNVTVLCDRFDKFQCNKKFDVITLIGVLEYANVFMSGDKPFVAMLEQVRTFLKPNGKLLIAIENQLGLKYFAGAHEDHVDIPMYGIEGRYQTGQPQTFGRKQINELLKKAGFDSTTFMAPFPDYKLPVTIVSERGFSTKSFDAQSLVKISAKTDRQLPPDLIFSQELSWPIILENGLGMDLANSFLICASQLSNSVNQSKILAHHYSSERAAKYCKETTFTSVSNDIIGVSYKKLALIENLKKSEYLSWKFDKRGTYIQGETLFNLLIKTIMQHHWQMNDIVEIMKTYLGVIEEFANSSTGKKSITNLDFPVPGRLIDLIPQNIIIDGQGKSHVFDQEWSVDGDIPVGWLLFRSMLPLFHLNIPIGNTEVSYQNSRMFFLTTLFQKIGFGLTTEHVDKYVAMEKKFLSEVNCIATTWDWDDVINRPFKIHNLHEAAISNNEIFAKKIASQQALLEEAFSSLSWKVTKPLRLVGRFFRSRNCK